MHFKRLLIMAGLHFVAMYFLMYSMVNEWSNVFINLNNAYMAGVMTMPMLLIEGWIMGSMYDNKKALSIVMTISAILLVAFFALIRKQALIADKEFLRSMIPHHSGAILICREADIRDPEIQALCQSIIESQQSEIDQMNTIRERLD